MVRCGAITPLNSMMSAFDWKRLYEETFQCYGSPFMHQMMERKGMTSSKGMMSRLDAAALYALVKMHRPHVVLETGSFQGMSSTFILKGMADSGVSQGKLFSIDNRLDGQIGTLIPEELKDGFISIIGDVKELMTTGALPAEVDFFLHDSTHRYQYQRWELESFWDRLRPGGFLVSHDVDLNASFVDFISRTYAHDEKGYTDRGKTLHTIWGRIGLLGFIDKGERNF